MRLVNAEPSETYAYLYEHLDDNGIIAAQNALDDMPTIDAVEVVRCKDCKYSIVETKWNGKEYCACNWNGADVHEVDERHYCSYGERREGNETD